jgi:6,7-dimethyl-8-ribityllumazine synthase
VSPTESGPDPDATGLRLGVVAARFNEKHVLRLVAGALETLHRLGAARDAIEVLWVPGSLELPLAAKWLANRRGAGGAERPACHAVLAFGVIIRGETEHFRLVADQCARGLLEVSLETGVPVLNGVLACYDAGQVEARLGGVVGHTGVSTALAAVRMARLGLEQR